MAPADKAKLDGMIGIVAAGYYDSNGNGTVTFGSCSINRISVGSYSISNIGASDMVVAMPFSNNPDILVKPYKRSQTATTAYIKAISLSAPTTFVDTSFFFAVIKTV